MEKIEFTGAHNEKLAARLDTPSGEIRAYALFAHCFTCGKDILAASRIAKSLTGKGIAVFRFDFTGLGKSDGEFANTNFTSNVQDLVKAADYMRDKLRAPSILIGHSLGGTAVLSAAKMIDEVDAVVTIGAPADATHVIQNFEDEKEEIMEAGEAEVTLAGRSFKIRKQFIKDVNSQKLREDTRNLDRALLVMHAPLDNIVGIENAASIFKAAKHPKSFISLDKSDHLLSAKAMARYAAVVIAAWAERYVEPKGMADHEETVPADTVIVKSTGDGKFQQAVRVGKHRLLSDEPEDMGGEDTGPNPYDFLQIALGTCKSMTLAMYADRKNIPLEGVEIHMTHDRVHADDCEECVTSDGKLDRFDCEIVIRGDELTDKNRDRLIEIADKCPVHKTLSGEVIIRTTEKS